MTIEDEARAEAERYLDDQTQGGYLAWPESQIQDAMQGYQAGYVAGASRQPSGVKSYLNGDRDDEVDAAQIAMHEYIFGPEEPLTERDKSITRQAWRAALEATRDTEGGDREYLVMALYASGMADSVHERVRRFTVEAWADAILAAGFRRGAPADREQIAGEIAAEREDTEDGIGVEAYINGLMRAEQIVREGR